MWCLGAVEAIRGVLECLNSISGLLQLANGLTYACLLQTTNKLIGSGDVKESRWIAERFDISSHLLKLLRHRW
jgi:hypothetical protein